jgi:hypothetical protein
VAVRRVARFGILIKVTTRVYQTYSKTSQVYRGRGIDKTSKVSYSVGMINAIKDKYYTYPAGEFLAIREGGKVINMSDYHKYKIKKALTPVVARLLHTI